MSINYAPLTLEEFKYLTEDIEWASIDTETTGLNWKEDKLAGVSIFTSKGTGYIPVISYRTVDSAELHSGENVELVKEIVRKLFESTPIFGWNLKFDAHFVGCFPEKCIDVQTGYWLLHEEGAMSLKTVAPLVTGQGEDQYLDYKELLKEASDFVHGEIDEVREAYANAQSMLYKQSKKSEGSTKAVAMAEAKLLFPKPKATIQDIPIEWLVKYAIKDVVLPMLLWETVVRDNLKSDGLLGYFHSYEMPYLYVLWKMERRGIRVDREQLDAVSRECRATMLDTQAQIDMLVGHPLNVNSPKQLPVVLFTELGYEPTGRLTDSGNPSCDEAAMQMLHEKYGTETNLFELILEYRDAAKNEGTYAGKIPDLLHEGRLHVSFNNTGTVTGRLSAEIVQQIPADGPEAKKIRGAFIPKDGYSIIAADLSQAELRVLTHRSQDPIMLDVYRTGRDLHDETMKQHGLPLRKIAKTCNFGWIYRQGWRTYQKTLLFKGKVRRSDADCKNDLKKQDAIYSGAMDFYKATIRFAQEYGYTETVLGRRRHLPDINSKDYSLRSGSERMGFNTEIQGDTADIIKCIMILCEQTVPEAEMLLQIHDEVVFECPTELVEMALPKIKNIFEHTFSFSIPMVAEVNYGDSWGNAK